MISIDVSSFSLYNVKRSYYVLLMTITNEEFHSKHMFYIHSE